MHKVDDGRGWRFCNPLYVTGTIAVNSGGDNDGVGSAAGEVVLAAVSPYIIGQVARDDDRRAGRMIGRGTAIQFRTSSMVLIADHVLRNSVPEDISSYRPRSKGFGSQSRARSLPNTNGASRQPFQGVRDENLDVAALVFEGEIPSCRFFELPETAVRRERTPP